MIITLWWALLWRPLSCIHSNTVPTVSSPNETSITSQGSDTLVPHQAERKVTLEEKLSTFFHHAFLLTSDQILSQRTLSLSPVMSSTWAVSLSHLRFESSVFNQASKNLITARIRADAAEDRNTAETSALAFLSSHECICNLNLQPVGNENTSMGSAQGIKACRSHEKPDMSSRLSGLL